MLGDFKLQINRIYLDSNNKSPYRMIDYWINPPKDNSPETYKSGTEKSAYLHEIISNINNIETVLEIGCNVGRNIMFLKQKGYSISGIEINAEAVNMARQSGIDVMQGDAREKEIPGVDLIYTMACLEHIDDLKALPDTISNKCNYLVTIEDEAMKSDRHYPRNYADVFGAENQIFNEKLACKNSYLKRLLGIRYVPGLYSGFVTRVFQFK